jgi:hypothetical protein
MPIPVHTILRDKEPSMFVDTMKKYHKELREEGILRGQRDMLARQLRLKFGADEARAAWLDALSTAQLDLLAERLLVATAEPALRAEIDALAT